MAKFNIVKKFSLDFIDASWKDAYIKFKVLTVADVRETFPILAKIQANQEAEVSMGLESILSLVKSKFIEGKAVGEDGELVDLNVEDIENLPVEVLTKALSFLSQGATPPSTKP